MALNASEQAYAQELASQSGMPLSVAQQWVAAEGGGAGTNNWLNIMPSGGHANYATPQAGADAAANLIASSQAYSGIRSAIASKNPTAILQAIVASPWDGSNHYAGTAFGSYVASLGGGTATYGGSTIPTGANVTDNGAGVYSIASSQPSEGNVFCVNLFILGTHCLTDATARKLAGGAAMGAGALLMIVGAVILVGAKLPSPISVIPGANAFASSANKTAAQRRNDQLEEEYDKNSREMDDEVRSSQRADELQARREARRARRTGRTYDSEGQAV